MTTFMEQIKSVRIEQDDYIKSVDCLKNDSTELITFFWVLIDGWDPEKDKELHSDCLFSVPTSWLVEYLLNHDYFKEFIEGGEILEEWFDTYTHGDGYLLYTEAKEAGMLLSVQLSA